MSIVTTITQALNDEALKDALFEIKGWRRTGLLKEDGVVRMIADQLKEDVATLRLTEDAILVEAATRWVVDHFPDQAEELPVGQKEEEKLKYCASCEDDFYNGKNPLNVKRCWCLKEAELVMKKEVSINQRPPWTQEPIKTLSCYHRKGFVYVAGDQTR